MGQIPLRNRKSNRLKGHDYSTPGAYFVTICTKDRRKYLGRLKDSSAILSDAGKIAESNWRSIPEKFPFASIGEFIVMPNHIHGLIFLNDKAEVPKQEAGAGGITGNKNPMLGNNLSTILRWYKGRTTADIHKAGLEFEWQGRFHDRIVRSYDSLDRIKKYIRTNPEKKQKY